jgi:multiple sugar transport system permease protein
MALTSTEPVAETPQTLVRRSVAAPTGPRMSRFGKRTVQHMILIGISLAFLVPFLVMITTAFKTPGEIFSSVLPQTWTLSNFRIALSSMPFFRYLGNTLFLVGLNVGATLVSCPLVAYALAKLRWPGRTFVFGTVLATMMLPAQVTFIPLYLLWNKVGFVGTFWPLVIPQFFGTPFYIFLLRQFFLGVPNSYREAALIDGASELRTYYKIMLPQAKAALATVAIFQFVATWTDFILPLIYLNNSQDYTLSIGLYNFFNQHGVDWGPLMAACIYFTLPTVFVFMIAQRYFVSGIATRGVR